MPLTSTEMRTFFPITRTYAYLDHAAMAPLATPVRGRIAEMLVVGAESIAFIKNTTSGLGLVAAGLDWEQGDNIVSVDREFPGNIYPWMGLRRKGVELRLYRSADGRIDVRALTRLCDARTRVVAISAVQFWSGFRADLAALGTALRGRDAMLVVDAIQAAGAMQLDLSRTPVDFLCAGAQKWLLGPLGAGFAYVGPRMLDRLDPVIIGIDSVVREDEYFDYDLTFKPDARRFEEASPNYPGILGMGAAVNLLLRAGPPAVEAEILRLSDRLREDLQRRGYALVLKPQSPSERSGIVSFRHPRMVPAEVLTRLREAGVIISQRADFLRASPHYYNNDDDIDRLVEALPS